MQSSPLTNVFTVLKRPLNPWPHSQYRLRTLNPLAGSALTGWQAALPGWLAALPVFHHGGYHGAYHGANNGSEPYAKRGAKHGHSMVHSAQLFIK